jgi:integrase
MTVDGHGGYYVRSPFKKVPSRYKDREAAIEAAMLLAELVERERQARLLDAGKPTIAGLVDRFIADRIQFMPWKKGTLTNNVAKLKLIRKELGYRLVERTDAIFLNDWLAARCEKADTFMKWRYILVLLWKFALFHEWVTVNSAENVPERSTSLVIDANAKDRQPLDVAGYKSIYAVAAPWLQLAMDLSLLTLQGRSEVINLRHADFRDGYAFVIREKVNAKSDAAFIRIKITPELEKLKSRSLLLDNTVSPFLVHRAPDSRKRRDLESKKGKHWTWVIPNYLTNAFADARDQSGYYAHLADNEQPSFHEIRGLGSRLYEAYGIAEEAITKLMSHADSKTTEIYLKGGAKALRDTDYVPVEAPLTLSEMLK